MQQIDRQCLSRRECEFIGHKLGFDLPSLNAALEYLRQLNILSFFEALPGVIFGSSQVILDKITELVTYNLELKDNTEAMSGEQRKFLHQGIVSLQILESPQLGKHYKEGLFEPRNLLDILVSKFVLTEVGPNEFMMPSVMEVSDIYPSPPLPEGYVQSSFVLHFSKKSPMIGIYCCAISYLMTDAGWELLRKGGEAVQVSRNSITFELPGSFSGKLTFLDPLSSYLEVVVEFITAEHRAALYHKIRETFCTAIEKAMQNLNYEVMTPELSFLCPEQSSKCDESPHLAKVNAARSSLTCSISPGSVSRPLSEDQLLWLHSSDSGELQSLIC